jgi:hypothetical protein
VLVRPNSPPSQLDPPTLRTYCRNPKCRGKLKIPVENERAAFCCRGCYAAFYRRRCLVCDQLFDRKSEKRRICNRAKCRYEFRSDRARFLASGYPSARNAEFDARSARKMGVSTPPFSGRPWRQVAGPDLGPNFSAAVVPDGPNCQWKGGMFERLEAQNRALLAAAGQAEINTNFSAPNWHEVTSPDGVTCFVTRVCAPAPKVYFRDGIGEFPHYVGRSDRADLAIPADLSIPNFLKRTNPAAPNSRFAPARS